jgi:hypothetical protein
MIPVEDFLKGYEHRAQSIAAPRLSHNPAQLYAVIHDAASRRWRIFPVPPASSLHASVTSAQIGVATHDLVTLEELADAYPGCRWGLATGQASGVFALEMKGALGRAALSRFAALYMEEFSDFQTLTSQAGESGFGFFRYPAGLAMRRGGRHPEPGLTIHGENDFVLLPPFRYSPRIAHEYFNPEETVAAAPQCLQNLAFEAVKENSVPRIPPHRAEPDSMLGLAKPSAKAESQNFGRKGWPAFGQTTWRRKINFPRRA